MLESYSLMLNNNNKITNQQTKILCHLSRQSSFQENEIWINVKKFKKGGLFSFTSLSEERKEGRQKSFFSHFIFFLNLLGRVTNLIHPLCLSSSFTFGRGGGWVVWHWSLVVVLGGSNTTKMVIILGWLSVKLTAN